MSDSDTKRYSYEELLALNHPDLSSCNLRLCGFFKDISENSFNVQVGKDIRDDYPNIYNIYFNKLKTRPIHLKNSDPEFLKKLRAILAKLSPSNIDTFATQIVDLLNSNALTPKLWKQIAELFYINIIDSIFTVDVYTKLLIKLEETHPRLIHLLHHLIHKEALQPRQFETDNIRLHSFRKCYNRRCINSIRF